MLEPLHDQDLQSWIASTIQHLKNRQFEALDIEYLIEELNDLGKSEKNALTSNLMILLAHLPLKSFLLEAINKAYSQGRKLAIKESKFAAFGVRIADESEYPDICPFSVEQILDEDFYS
jgi:hypothetical protein